jgi:hypothetical protein
MDLNLIWNVNDNIILIFVEWLNEVIPEHEKIKYNINDNRLFSMARNLENYLAGIIKSHDGMTNIEGQIFYIGAIENLNINITISENSQRIFPDVFFVMESIDPELLDIKDEDIKMILQLLKDRINHNTGINPNLEFIETWHSKSVNIYNNKEKVLVQDFEKTQLGNFLYLLYLRDKYASDPNVCVIISELIPLINKVSELERNLVSLTETQFRERYISYAKFYNKLKMDYGKKKPEIFRLDLLYMILNASSPYISASINVKYEKVVEISKTFSILLDRCINKKSRYIISFCLLFVGGSGHANILIIDKKDNIIERFEPNGSIFLENEEYSGLIKILDDKLTVYFSNLGYKYKPPQEFCPNLGIQLVENKFTKKTGFCVSWSIIYAIERVESNVSREYISQNLLPDLIFKHKLQGRTEQETASKIERWLSDYIDDVFNSLGIYYKQLSKLLDINLEYQKTEKNEKCLIWK